MIPIALVFRTIGITPSLQTLQAIWDEPLRMGQRYQQMLYGWLNFLCTHNFESSHTTDNIFMITDASPQAVFYNPMIKPLLPSP